MPWSDWRPGATAIVSWQKFTASRLFYGGELTPGWETNPPGTEQLLAEQWEVGFDDFGYGTEETRVFGMFFSVGSTWKTRRDWFPIELFSLEEGVDYGIRPDRTDMDDDAYVEYETSGDNAVIEEFKPILTYQGGDSGAGDGTWALGYVPNPTLPDFDSAVRAYPVETWPGLGTVFAVGGVEAIGTSHSAAFPSVVGLSTLLVSPKMTGPAPTADAEGARFTIGAPSFRYQMPRWRYWIPGELPLRQKQRDDGLALRGAPSWRQGSSRQASNRWRSYL